MKSYSLLGKLGFRIPITIPYFSFLCIWLRTLILLRFFPPRAVRLFCLFFGGGGGDFRLFVFGRNTDWGGGGEISTSSIFYLILFFSLSLSLGYETIPFFSPRKENFRLGPILFTLGNYE